MPCIVGTRNGLVESGIIILLLVIVISGQIATHELNKITKNTDPVTCQVLNRTIAMNSNTIPESYGIRYFII